MNRQQRESVELVVAIDNGSEMPDVAESVYCRAEAFVELSRDGLVDVCRGDSISRLYCDGLHETFGP